MKVYKMMTQRKNKEGKNFYEPIGTMFMGEYEGKPSISGYLNTNPDVKVYFFEQKPRQNSQNTGQNAGQNIPPQEVADELADFQAPTGDDSVPF